MRKNINILVVLLIVCGLFAACGNTETERKGANGSIKESFTDNRLIENKSNVEKTSPTPTNIKKDEVPKFKKGEEYKSVREKLIKAGWKPYTSPEADNCDGDDERCKDYPEMQNCAGTGLGNCRYVWKKDVKTLLIFTVGDSPVYDGKELQITEKNSKPTRFIGKYVYRSKHEYGYDEFVYELKENGVATFTSTREGGDGENLTGKWFEADEIITIIFNYDEGKDRVVSFSFDKGDLIQTTDPDANENYKGFLGKIFKKN